MDETTNIQDLLTEKRRLLISSRKKEQKKLSRQEHERSEASKWLQYSQMADTLLATPDAVKKGDKEVLIDNCHTGEPFIIALNPKCNAERNAELLYKKARRGKRGFDQCEENLALTQVVLAQLQEQIETIDTFRSEGIVGSETQALAFLESLSDLTKQNVHGSKKEVVKPPFRHYTIDGWDIYAGKSSTNNDELSVRFAKPSDIWFHAVGYAGSHVIIKRAKGTDLPPQKIIDIAGGISVFFSKAKHSSYAEVHMCEARFVRKPRKAPAGLVTIERFKTLRMSPVDPQKLFK